VLAPTGVLPQQAEKLDADSPAGPDEILIAVSALNVDSASFHQFMAAAGGDPEKAAAAMLAVIEKRGKLQNPITGSGGMLIGTVVSVGEQLDNPELERLKPGDRVATLVSLTLTPLKIQRLLRVIPAKDRLEVLGSAILFSSGIAAKLPSDLDEGLALAALDVCGAPAQVARLVQPGMKVAVIGAGGKSGLLCLFQARKILGRTGRLVAFEYSAEACERLRGLTVADQVVQGNAKDPLATSAAIVNAMGGERADLVINVANVAGTEMASILPVKNRGTVYFFSMATSFSSAALGAEGVGSDVDLMIGNGYAAGHGELTLQLLRETPALRKLFSELYCNAIAP
jgi:L-erythro-3,5-diaminohexanoate dehydrogenase